APYRIPLFNALARDPRVDLDVVFLARDDPRRGYPVDEREFRFDSRILHGVGVVRDRRWAVLNAGVLYALWRIGPRLGIVGGWNQPAFWQAAAYARVRGIPLVVWVESTARDERRGDGPAERAKRLFVAGATAVLVPGRAAADYARSLGARRV